jgi:hypothetical protein
MGVLFSWTGRHQRFAGTYCVLRQGLSPSTRYNLFILPDMKRTTFLPPHYIPYISSISRPVIVIVAVGTDHISVGLGL